MQRLGTGQLAVRTVARLLGRSAFAALQIHMQSVERCVLAGRAMLDALFAGQLYPPGDGSEQQRRAAVMDAVARAEVVSKLEYEADRVRSDIRSGMSQWQLLTMDRGHFQAMLHTQDSLADGAEELAVLLSYRPLHLPEALRGGLREYLARNMEAFEGVQAIIRGVEAPLLGRFTGGLLPRVDEQTQTVALHEHESSVMQRGLLDRVYGIEEQLSIAELVLWLELIGEIGQISRRSEKLANQMCLALGAS